MALPPFRPGDHAEKELLLTREEIVRVATELGDPNPLHHDEEVARRTPFGGLIACGGHLIGLLTSFSAAFSAPRGPGVGLDFSYQLRRAARAGTRLRLRWEVTKVERSSKLRGELVTLAGSIVDASDRTLLVRGKGRILKRPDLG